MVLHYSAALRATQEYRAFKAAEIACIYVILC